MTIRELILAALFAALTAVSALITIPLTLVPFTLQVLVVLTAGVIVGKKIGLMSMITYTLLGCVGLPVFAGGNSGLGYLSGPTGGFVLGFMVAVFVVGWLVEVFDKRFKTSLHKLTLYIVCMLVGLTIIYGLGLIRLSMLIGFEQAVAVAFIPYIIPDLVKVVVGAYIAVLVKVPLVKAGLIEI